MASSIFVPDVQMTYEDYVRWIYTHATRYTPPAGADAALLERTANAVFAMAQQCYANGSVDMAYYYAVRTLQFFDATGGGVDVRRLVPRSSELLARALSFAEALKSKLLRELYVQRMAEVQAREAERRQVVARQYALDDNANMRDTTTLLNDKQSAHDLRRQELLQREAQRVNVLAGQLATIAPGTAATTTPQPAAPLPPSPVSVATTTTTPPARPLAVASPAPQRQQQNAPQPVPSARRYEAWAFATAHPMTAARRGIVNLGNTCYMNSVLQMLNCTPLADYFAQGTQRGAHAYSSAAATSHAQAQAMQLASCFTRLVCDLRERGGGGYAVSASAFKRAFGAVYSQFDNHAQQDANEFLRLLLDVLHTAVNPLQQRSNGGGGGGGAPQAEIDNVHGSDEAIAARYWQQYVTHNMSVIVDVCAFQERSELRCPQCAQSSRSFAPSFALELAIASSSPVSRSRVSLEDCLDAYCRAEVLGADSLYLCPGCKQRVRATKQMLFYTTPDVLFVTLKRFNMLGDFTNAAKNNSVVYIPGNLNLAPYMCTSSSPTSTQYALVALVNHQGNMYGGHYTADCRGVDGAWAHFSDEVVSRADKPALDLAYILCYRRITT